MFGGYLNGKATWTPMGTPSRNGGLQPGSPVSIECQVVDDTRVEGSNGGRDLNEGVWSVVIVPLDYTMSPGDFLQVTEVRGQTVSRPQRTIKSVDVVGGFSASHQEVLI